MTDINGNTNRTCLHWTEWEERAKKLEKENAELKDKNKALELYGDLADGKVDEVKLMLAERIKVLEAENDRLRAEINEQNQTFRVLEKMYDDAFDELREAKKVLKDLIPIVSRAKKLIKE